MTKKPDFTLIYSTCDDYSFLWNDFFKILFKKWPGFDSPIISTGTQPISCYSNIKYTKTRLVSFSSRLIKALHKANTEIVLLFLDDFFLTEPVNEKEFNNALKLIKENKTIKCINFVDSPSSKDYGRCDYDDNFVIKKNDVRYSVTTQVSFWRKKYLLKLLHAGEDAWEFEKYSQERHKHYDGLFLYRKDSCNNIFVYPEGGVFQKGKVRQSEDVIKLLQEENIDTSGYVFFSKKKKKRCWRFRQWYKKFYFRNHIRISWLPFIK